MAANTLLERSVLSGIVEEYGLGKLVGSDAVSGGLGNTHNLLKTARTKCLLKVDKVKSELEVKREIDLLLFLRKYGFPCSQPLSDCKGRYYRNLAGKCVSLYKHVEGDVVETDDLNLNQLENLGRVLADLHLIGKSYKKGIENRYSFERVVDGYREVRAQLPAYFRKIIRTLDDEIEYLRSYLEGKLPKGIIQGALFPDNVLFRGDKVVSVINFEAASRGKSVYDIATAVNALCFEGGSYNLKRFEALITGYQSQRTLSLAEWDAFPNELRFSALRFTITRLNDFFRNKVGNRFGVSRGFQDFYDRLRILRREEDGGMEGLLMAMATGYDYRKYQKVKVVDKKSE